MSSPQLLRDRETRRGRDKEKIRGGTAVVFSLPPCLRVSLTCLPSRQQHRAGSARATPLLLHAHHYAASASLNISSSSARFGRLSVLTPRRACSTATFGGLPLAKAMMIDAIVRKNVDSACPWNSMRDARGP